VRCNQTSIDEERKQEMTNWKLKQLSISERKCDCCEDRLTCVSGIVLDGDGDELAEYSAVLMGQGLITLLVEAVVVDDETESLDTCLVKFLVRDEDGVVLTSIDDPDDRTSPFMTEKEVDESPDCDLILDVCDFIIENDPTICSYLWDEDDNLSSAELKCTKPRESGHGALIAGSRNPFCPKHSSAAQ